MVNRRDEFIGQAPISKVLISDPTTTIREIGRSRTFACLDARRRSRSAFRTARSWSAPVVSENGKLLGRITIDDVVDVIRRQLMRFNESGGLDEDEMSLLHWCEPSVDNKFGLGSIY